MKTPNTLVPLNKFRISRRAGFILATALIVFVILPLGVFVARAANTTNNFTGSSTGSLLTPGNWSLGHVPTVSEDAVFTASTGIRTLTAGSLTVGSFDVTASAGTFSIRNETTTSTNSTLTLGGAGDTGNGVSGTGGDLLYAAGGSTFNIIGPNGSSGSGVLNLVLGQSGNFNSAGTMSVSSVISNGGGFGITKTGTGSLTLSGSNTYGGDTTISNGTLALSGSGSIANSPNIILAGGSTFDVSTLTSPLTLASGQGLKGGGATTTGSINTASGKGLTTAANSPLQFTAFNGTTAPLTISGAGTVTLASGNPVTVTTTTPLGAGDYTLISKGASGTVNGTTPTSITVNGSGITSGAIASLQITGGQLVLHVTQPVLGTYTGTSVALSGDTTITPSAAPTNAARINVSTSTNFKGKLEANPATGAVRITNAHPAGTYTVTVKAFASDGSTTTKTFNETVTTPTTCSYVGFNAGTNYTVGTSPYRVAVGDFNGDGKQDIVTANANSNNVSVLLGAGDGTFGPKTDFPAGTSSRGVAVGDFNGDGKQDLAVANVSSGDVSILLGTGTGSFGAPTSLAAGTQPFAVAVADFNNDGKQDLVAVNALSNNVSIFIGNGNGTFGAATNFAVRPDARQVIVADFGSDGDQDVTTANNTSSNISVLPGTGTGSFGAEAIYPAGSNDLDIALGDFNGDGKQDLVTANDGTGYSVFIQQSSGSAFDITTTTSFSGSSAVAVGDFNDDGKQDFALTRSYTSFGIPHNEVDILQGNGSGSFFFTGVFGVGNNPIALAVGDFNGDGRQDIVTANTGANEATVLLAQCTPQINVSTNGPLTFANTGAGSTSAEQSYTVSANNLTADLVINAPSDFQISTTSGSNFGSNVTISPSNGIVSATTIYVRFAPGSTGFKSGNVTSASTGATTQNLAVSGTGVLKYRSAASGNWNSNSTWETSLDGVTFTPATSTPTAATADTIEIQSTHTVTVTANVDADRLTVNSGGTLSVANGVTFTVADATGTDLTVNGTANVNGTGVIGGAGSFALNSGATLGVGSAAGITAGTNASGNIQLTGGRIYGNGASYIYDGTTDQAAGDGLPQTVANLTILNSSAGNTLTGNSGQTVTGLLRVQKGVYSSHSGYDNVQIDAGGTLSLTNDITVGGDWTNDGAFNANGHTVTFDGTGAQTITTGGSGAGKSFAGVNINKSSGTATLAGDLSDTALTISAGTFDQGASFGVFTGAVNVNAGTWSNTGTGDLQLSGDVSNGGTITFNANGTGCPQNDDISITSSSPGTQHNWSGAGTFVMTDVSVRDQAGTAIIGVRSGTNAGHNGLNWAFVSQCSAYTWAGTVSTDWTNPLNWSPARTTPAASDILYFGAGTPSPTVTNVAGALAGVNQTIAELHVNNSSPNFSTGGANTLTINAGAGVTGLDISGSAPLTLGGSNPLTITLASGTLGSVSGTMNVGGGGHRLIGQAAGAITFQNGLTFTTTSGFTGNAFGDGSDTAHGAPGSVVFANGSAYFQHAGGSPFGASGNASVVVFQTGSEADFLTDSGFDASGRTYANLVIGNNSTPVNAAAGGAGNFQFDNLMVNAAGSTNSSLAFNGSGSSAVTIQGNVTSNGAGTGTLPDVSLTPGSGGVTINAGAPVTFGNDTSNARSISLDGNVTVANGTTLTLSRVVQLGFANPNSKTLTAGGTLVGGASGYVIGTVKKTFGAAGSKTFEVGTANGYSPVDVNVTSGTFPADFNASASQAQEPHAHGAGVNALKRYWTLSGSGVTADLTFHYLDPADVPASFTDANYVIFKYDTGFSTPGGTLDASANTANIGGVTSFSDWTLADPSAVAPGTLQFVAAPYTDNETNSDHDVTINVSRTGGTDGAVDVTYAASDGTATDGSDYISTSGTLHWDDGETGSKSFPLTIKGDTAYEADETVNLTLSNATDGAAIGGTNPTTLTITNDDAPPSTLVVNTTADTDDGLCSTDPGGCTLREAINAANSNADANTITFNIPANDPGCTAGVCTINLTGALPDLTTNMTISGPGASQLTVQRSTPGNTPNFRVFSVTSGVTVTISGLAVSNGSSNDGSGIFNGGTLNIINSTVSGNTGAFTGGGISNNQGTVNVTGSTISGNSSVYGGGISSNGTVNVVNSTISGNSGDNGGGIYSSGAFSLRNAIVALNSASSGPDILGSATSLGHNVVGSTSGATISPTTGDQFGVSAAQLKLGALQDNGGPTQTMALGAGSVAIDAGDDCVADVAHCGDANISQLTTDQRGAGFTRQADGDGDGTATVDIGAFEAPFRGQLQFSAANYDDPEGDSGTHNATVTVQRVGSSVGAVKVHYATSAGTATAGTDYEDTSGDLQWADGLSDDQTFNVTVHGDTTFEPDEIVNLALSSPTGGAGLGSPSTATLTIKNDDPANTNPTVNAATGLSRQQGSPASNSQIATVGDAESGAGGVTVTVTSANPSNGVTLSSVSNDGGGNVKANIVADCTATNATFTLTADDGASGTASDTLSVSVTANDAPTLTYPGSQSVALGGSLDLTPTAASDNGSITGYSIQSISPALTAPTPMVDSNGVVSITNARPAGGHTITVRATDNCGATKDAQFTLDVVAADLSVMKADSQDPVTEGNDLTYTITAHNAGPGDATGVSVGDPLPAGTTLVSSTPSQGSCSGTGVVTCNLGSLGNGQDATVQITVNVSSSVAGTTISNTATVSATEADPDTDNNSATETTQVSAAACTQPPTGMVAWYPGDGNADDIAGGHNGTLQNGATFAPGKVGQAFQFDGVNNYVEVPDPADGSLDIGGDITVDAWIKPTVIAGDQRSIVNKRSPDGSAVNINLLLQPNGQLVWAPRIPADNNFSIYQTTASVPAGVFTHVAVTLSGSTLTFYINGSPVTTVLNAVVGPANDGPFTIGAIPANSQLLAPFAGQIDEVEVFNRALSQQEIANLHNASFAGKCHASTVQFSQAAYAVAENDAAHQATITLTRTGARDTQATVHYATGAGSATNGDDYTDVSSDLTFNPGDVSQTFTIPISDDGVFEGDETVNLQLSNASGAGASLGTQQTAVLTIQDNETQPTISIDDVTRAEGNGSTTAFAFHVTLSNPSAQTVTVSYATADATANAPSDYTAKSDTLTFDPGDTSKTVTVLVNGDAAYEHDETFFVNLSGPTEATITNGQGVGTINNDDRPPATLVVNTTDDLNSGFCLASHCSLREAIVAANSNSDTNTINFQIPASDPGHFYYADDSATGQVSRANVTATTASDDATISDVDPDWPHSWWTISPQTALPSISAPATIDGYTQTGATANTSATGDDAVLRVELNGAGAGLSTNGLTLGSSGSTLKGLIVNRFGASGVSLPGGLHVVSGNFLGTDASGTLALANGAAGLVSNGFGNLVGGTAPAARNLISGNTGDGVSFTGGNSHLVQGNLIGTKPDGAGALGNGASGVGFTGGGTLFNTVGGTNSGEANTIAFNGGDGVHVDSTAGISHNIRGNSIHDNGTTTNNLGIDLGSDGVTPNDAQDADAGPNNLQNFPVITALRTGSTKTITGTLNSKPNQTFTIDFYTNPSCDASGNGEGKTYIGSLTTATTDANGDVSFTLHPTSLSLGDVVTATATDSSGNTSEFSQCATTVAGNAGTVRFGQSSYTVAENVVGGLAHITVQRVGGSDGSVSATFSTSDGSAHAGSDYTAVVGQTVTFNDGDTADKTVDVSVTDDSIYEHDETVNLSLSSTTVNTPGVLGSPQTSVSSLTSATLTITSDDAPPTLAVNDVSHAEGNTGTTDFTFTVTKTGATAFGTSVDVTTADVTANAPSDYTALPTTTLTFLPSETTKTVTVHVNGDTTPEVDETFNVLLSNPLGATVSDGTGVGTITNDDESVSAGQLIISEFRLRGPGGGVTTTGPTAATPAQAVTSKPRASVSYAPSGSADTSPQANDEFVELYNATDSPLLVTTTDSSKGWAVAASDGAVRFVIPAGTVIPARGHFLGVNTLGYSLSAYPAGNDGANPTTATGDPVLLADGSPAAGYTLDIPDNAGLAVFRTADAAHLNAGTRLDSAGSTSESNALYKEGAGYPALLPSDIAQNLEHSFYRSLCSFQQGACTTPGVPKDTGDNAADFLFVDTKGTPTAAGQRLGAPGPENLSSHVQRNTQMPAALLDRSAPVASPPNRVRDFNSDPTHNSPSGTLSIRRRVTNGTGSPVVQLRFRVVEVTTFPAPAGTADLRARSSGQISVTGVGDTDTCGGGATPCTATVRGTTVEEPPTQLSTTGGTNNGGGFNSSLSVGTITLSQPLAPGDSVNVQFLLGIRQPGNFRILVNIETVTADKE